MENFVHENPEILEICPTHTNPPTPVISNYGLELSSPSQRFENNDDDDDAYFKSFPPGYKFNPDDDELIVHYLNNKILGLELPRNKIIEVKLYDYNPKDIAVKYEHYGTKVREKKWYIFTPRDRKYKNGHRPNRAAGNGYWKATGADKKIEHKGKIVGYRKSLVFYEGKPPKGNKTNWIMHEFRVVNPPKPKPNEIHDMKLDDWVLCSIHEKDERLSSKNRQREDSVGDENEYKHNNNVMLTPYDDHSSLGEQQNQSLFSNPISSCFSMNVDPSSINLLNHQSSSTNGYPSFSFYNHMNHQVLEYNNDQFDYVSYGNFASYGENSPLRSSWNFNPTPDPLRSSWNFIPTPQSIGFHSHGTVHDDLIYNGDTDFQSSGVHNSIPPSIVESFGNTPQRLVKTKTTETFPDEKPIFPDEKS